MTELKSAHHALQAVLLVAEPSLAVTASQTFSKSLLLAGASEMEADVQRILIEYYEEATAGTLPAVEFIRRKALKRQYHTLFDWEATSAKAFFSLFGSEFRDYVTTKVSSDEHLKTSISDFLHLGSLRNQLVHGNFAAFSLSMTADEIFELYSSATGFRDALPGLLRRE